MADRNYLTIVSGLPRSGTSMMMKMVEAGGIPVITDGKREADVDNPKGYYEFEPALRTKADPSWLRDAPGKCVKMVYMLLKDLPVTHYYRILFMRRNLDEVLASQKKMLDRLGKSGGDLSDEQFRELFAKEIDKCLEWMNEQPHIECLQVDYNQMISDAAPLVTQVNEFLGGDMNVPEMSAVVDPSLHRNKA